MVRFQNKNVPRPDQSDIVLAQNSTSTCYSTISTANAVKSVHHVVSHFICSVDSRWS